MITSNVPILFLDTSEYITSLPHIIDGEILSWSENKNNQNMGSEWDIQI